MWDPWAWPSVGQGGRGQRSPKVAARHSRPQRALLLPRPHPHSQAREAGGAGIKGATQGRAWDAVWLGEGVGGVVLSEEGQAKAVAALEMGGGGKRILRNLAVISSFGAHQFKDLGTE